MVNYNITALYRCNSCKNFIDVALVMTEYKSMCPCGGEHIPLKADVMNDEAS